MGTHRADCGFISPVVSGCDILPPMYNSLCLSPPQTALDIPLFAVNEGMEGCPGQPGMYILQEQTDCDIEYGESYKHLCGQELRPPIPSSPVFARYVGRKQKLPRECFDTSKTWAEKIASNPMCSCIKEVLEKGGIPQNSPQKAACKCLDPDPAYSQSKDCFSGEPKKCASFCGECWTKLNPSPSKETCLGAWDPDPKRWIPGIIDEKTKICMPCSIACGDCGIIIPNGKTTQDNFTYDWIGHELLGVPDIKKCICRRCESFCGECVIEISVWLRGSSDCMKGSGQKFTKFVNGIWDIEKCICRFCEPNPFTICGCEKITARVPIAERDKLNAPPQDACKERNLKENVPPTKEIMGEETLNIRWRSNTDWQTCGKKGRDGLSHNCGECEATLATSSGKNKKVAGIWSKSTKENKVKCVPCAQSAMAAKYVKNGKLVNCAIMIAEEGK